MFTNVTTIKESNEVVDAFEAEIATVEKITADGKINALDIPSIIVALPKLVTGINGCWNVPAEISGASSAERQALVMRCAGLLPRAWTAHVALINILAGKKLAA